ncbi:hypothetical protein Dsin_018315 [Dipteronia sinensis]|uniref:Uncharacterized protein n=1 Tax=Dipteronia sinensis TaxID=43782 RepID=A0AAE0E302_9ROSI|nr:hypothetical protein Dsin_018315 [Dipteronia sinensis]
MDAAAYDLLEEMAINNSHWGSKRQLPKKSPGVHKVDELTSVKAQLNALKKQMKKMGARPSQVQVASCEWCLGPHSSMECQVSNTFALGTPDQVTVGDR